MNGRVQTSEIRQHADGTRTTSGNVGGNDYTATRKGDAVLFELADTETNKTRREAHARVNKEHDA